MPTPSPELVAAKARRQKRQAKRLSSSPGYHRGKKGLGPSVSVVRHAPGKPDCSLCRGAGVSAKVNRDGLHRECKCISAEAKAARAAEVEAHNKLTEQLKVKLAAPEQS